METSLHEFYQSYIVDTVNGSFQIFQSMTYGEIIISFLLLIIIFIMILKWVYQVII